MSQAPGHGREINQKHAKGSPSQKWSPVVRPMCRWRSQWDTGRYGISLYLHHSTPQSQVFFGSIFVKNTLLTSKILLVYVRWILQTSSIQSRFLEENSATSIKKYAADTHDTHDPHVLCHIAPLDTGFLMRERPCWNWRMQPMPSWSREMLRFRMFPARCNGWIFPRLNCGVLAPQGGRRAVHHCLVETQGTYEDAAESTFCTTIWSPPIRC